MDYFLIKKMKHFDYEHLTEIDQNFHLNSIRKSNIVFFSKFFLSKLAFQITQIQKIGLTKFLHFISSLINLWYKST